MKKSPRHNSQKEAASEAKSLEERFGGSRSAGQGRRQFGWSPRDRRLMVEAVSRVCGAGDAIMFGVTRDGGAGVVTILSGDARKRWYPSSETEKDACLKQIIYAYMEQAERIQSGWVTDSDVITKDLPDDKIG